MVLVRRIAGNMLRKKLKLDPIESAPNLSAQSNANGEHQDQSSQNSPKPLNEDKEESRPNVMELNNSSLLADQLLELELSLNLALKKLKFKSPVEYVYHPLDYAYNPHSAFTKKYCTSPKKILFLGMNPGPWGMCQTGVPFGEVNIVKDWFKIDECVSKPEKECKEREVLGLACPKSEVSGKRIWGLFRNICNTPENFFKSAYMYNYCPIAMLKSNGSNITPTEIKADVQRELEELCDETLYKVIQLLQAEIVIGVGKYAEKRALEVLKDNNHHNTQVFYLLHPSPRVANNQNWLVTAEKRLIDLDLLSYFKS